MGAAVVELVVVMVVVVVVVGGANVVLQAEIHSLHELFWAVLPAKSSIIHVIPRRHAFMHRAPVGLSPHACLAFVILLCESDIDKLDSAWHGVALSSGQPFPMQ